MRVGVLLWVAGLVLGGWPPALHAASSTRPCLCRHAGGTAKQGETVCLIRDGRHQLARCEMVLNNASWHFLEENCGPVAADSSLPLRSDG